MFKSRKISIIILCTVVATGAFLSARTANAYPSCPPGVECPNDGSMHYRHQGHDRSSSQQPNEDQSMEWRHRHRHDYSDNGVGFGIYLNSGYGDGYYGDGYGYNDGYGDGYRWRHHRHCRTIKIWRNHHPVWVKRCRWHH